MPVKNETEYLCKFRDILNNKYGIFYPDSKMGLLRIKLDKCIARAGVSSYEEYYLLLHSNKKHFIRFVNQITVNKTEFFRESKQFDFLNDTGYVFDSNPGILRSGEIRVWSMACSSGQEPCSIAIVLKEVLPPDINIRILATDINNDAIKTAAAGVYSQDAVKDIAPGLLKKYFIQQQDGNFRVAAEILGLIKYRYFNLISDYCFKKSFDIILCKNVLIYFSHKTQQSILNKIYDNLSDGGLLFLGLSDSMLNKKHSFIHVMNSIYLK